MRSAFWVYGLAATVLGAVALLFGDMPLHAGNVPAGLPGRALIALAWGAGLLLAGLLAMVPRTGRAAALALAAGYAVYALWFTVPGSLAAASSAGGWLALCEVAVLACGGAMLWASGRGRAGVAARILFGLCAIDFGLCHFVYVDITASLVPHWLFAPKFWAYLTGAGHCLAGLALIGRVRNRLAATLEAAMCATFVLLVHVPAVAAAPADKGQWAMLAIACAIAAAAWTMRLAPEQASSAQARPADSLA